MLKTPIRCHQEEKNRTDTLEEALELGKSQITKSPFVNANDKPIIKSSIKLNVPFSPKLIKQGTDELNHEKD